MKIPLLLVASAAIAAAPVDAPEASRVESRGKWVLDLDGKPTPPASFTRGLQTSGLVYRKGELWALGDQRSRYPGHLYRINPRSARMTSRPVKLELPPDRAEADRQLQVYAGIPNSDFEALCLDPRDPDVLFAVTEDKVPWIATIVLARKGDSPAGAGVCATLDRLTALRFPDSLRSWRGDTNFRFEGITISDDGADFYLAFERADDDLPRICRVPRSALYAGGLATPEILDFDFKDVPARADKPGALLNINGIQFLRQGKSALLVAILRDQERLILMDLDRHRVKGVVDLLLLDPDGGAIKWVSPEGIAADPESDRLWIINDPDSVRGNYRGRDTSKASGPFADYTPLLFELELGPVLSGSAAKRRATGGTESF